MKESILFKFLEKIRRKMWLRNMNMMTYYRYIPFWVNCYLIGCRLVLRKNLLNTVYWLKFKSDGQKLSKWQNPRIIYKIVKQIDILTIVIHLTICLAYIIFWTISKAMILKQLMTSSLGNFSLHIISLFSKIKKWY